MKCLLLTKLSKIYTKISSKKIKKEQKRYIDTDNLNRKRKQNILHREQLLKRIVVDKFIFNISPFH